MRPWLAVDGTVALVRNATNCCGRKEGEGLTIGRTVVRPSASARHPLGMEQVKYVSRRQAGEGKRHSACQAADVIDDLSVVSRRFRL
jgi:hypothetical protein